MESNTDKSLVPFLFLLIKSVLRVVDFSFSENDFNPDLFIERRGCQSYQVRVTSPELI